MISLLLLTMLSVASFAEDCTNCTPEIKAPFEAVVKNVEVLQAPTEINCNETLKESAKLEYQNLFGNLPKQQRKIRGINLEGTAEELTYLNKMLGDKPTDRWSLANKCKTVLCAVTKIYDSEETAQRALNIAKRDGYIISAAKDFTNEKGQPFGDLFNLSEIRNIDLAYKMLPTTYKKLRSLDVLKRMPRGQISVEYSNAAAYAVSGYHSEDYNRNGEITFVDKSFPKQDESLGPYAAVHELTHHVDYSNSKISNYGLSQSSTFLQMSGWKKKDSYEIDAKTGEKSLVTNWEHRADKKFVSEYAGTEPAEDFAESAAHYVFHPKELKVVDPEKYDFLKKNVFAGREYISEIELGVTRSELLRICIDSNKEYRLYGNSLFSTSSISPTCLDGYMKDFKVTDPKLCSFNMDQIKSAIFDNISAPIVHLNNALLKCDQDLLGLEKECLSEGNYQRDCSVKKYFSKNTLTVSDLNLSEEESKQIQEKFIGKIQFASFATLGNRDDRIIQSIQGKLGKSNFLSVVLMAGLSDRYAISNQYVLTNHKAFLDNANIGLAKKLESIGSKFDSSDLARMFQTYLILDKGVNAKISSFQAIVLKKATKSKEKNLALIKSWAASQSLEDTPVFEELAESLRKYGGVWSILN